MNYRFTGGAILAGALVCSLALAADDLKSGPQPGDKYPGAFHPLNITNADTPGKNGQKNCYVWQYGGDPVALIFAREISDGLTSLVKKLDEEVGKNKAAKLHAAVVFLSDDEKLEKALKELGEKHKNVSFGLDNPAGPKAWNVAKEADVTIIMYTGRAMKVNQAFKKGNLKSSETDKIAGELSKILK